MGSFEIYSPRTLIAASIAQDTRELYIALVLGPGLLYVGLYQLVSRGVAAHPSAVRGEPPPGDPRRADRSAEPPAVPGTHRCGHRCGSARRAHDRRAARRPGPSSTIAIGHASGDVLLTRIGGRPAPARARREIRRAIDQHELVVFLQPKIDIASGRNEGAEALVRWQHRARLLGPGEFMSVVETTELDQAARPAGAGHVPGGAARPARRRP